MQQTLNEYLEERNANSDAIFGALQRYLGERTDYLPPEDMREEFLKQARDEAEADKVLAELDDDPVFAEQTARVVLAVAWEDPSEREKVREAFEQTEGTLLVVEGLVIAIVGMYGMYLISTGGKTKSIEITEKQPDGTEKKVKIDEYHSPSGPLSKITGLFQ
jgi:hypothetical protein